MAHVTIGPEFFSKAKNDYQNWRRAWIREILQNSMDSGATHITLSFEQIDAIRLKIIVADNGRGMTREVVVDKLLSLGSSGKDFKSGAVGGFGKAKELLYFAQESYTIYTNDLKITGRGGAYEIEQSSPIVGTRSEVYICAQSMEFVGGWSKMASEMVALSDFKGVIEIGNFIESARSNLGSLIREFKSGKLFDNLSVKHIGMIIYRVNGAPMFTHKIAGFDRGLIFEIATPCINHLSANRDGLTWEAGQEMSPFISELTIDKKSALLRRVAKITHYRGRKGRVRSKQHAPSLNALLSCGSSLAAGLSKSINGREVVAKIDFQKALIDYNFVIYHAKIEPLPEQWQIGTLSANAQWVAWAWSCAVWEVFLAHKKQPDFDFGFVFDDDCEARYSNGCFLINPCHADYKIKYARTRESACALLTLAAHEYVHHIGYGVHDEEYASVFTSLMKTVLFETPHIVTKMLDKDAQSSLDYEDYKSALALFHTTK